MNNSVAFVLFGLILTMWTCSDETDTGRSDGAADTDGAVVYTIPAGAHVSTGATYHPLNLQVIRFTARFDSSAIYQTRDSRNQADINKLYGIADCNSSHHFNSARFGWRWFDDSLQIWAYVYVNGERKMSFITSVPLNSASTYELVLGASTYDFKVNNSIVSLPRHCSTRYNGYKLYPYFGGDEPAPHDITIIIQDLP